MAWTEDKLILAKTLWIEGWPATYIAERLGPGFTRNAVIGKLHRLKLHRGPRQKPPKAEKPRKPNVAPLNVGRKAFLRQPANRLLPPERIHDPGPVHLEVARDIPIFQMKDDQCHFPTKPGRYCGHPVKPGKMYCEGHCQIIYMPVLARKSA